MAIKVARDSVYTYILLEVCVDVSGNLPSHSKNTAHLPGTLDLHNCIQFKNLDRLCRVQTSVWNFMIGYMTTW